MKDIVPIVVVIWGTYRILFGYEAIPVHGIITPVLYSVLGEPVYRFVFVPLSVAVAAWALTDPDDKERQSRRHCQPHA